MSEWHSVKRNFYVRTSIPGRGQVVKSDAFQGQSPLGSACNAVECASEGLTLFFANASLFIGMTPAGASIVRIDRRLNRVPFEYVWLGFPYVD